jgi:GIY-YIG catalytic domain-containing protein
MTKSCACISTRFSLNRPHRERGKMPRSGSIYAIMNQVTKARYIGSTVQPYTVRWALHRYELERGLHRCQPLQVAWQHVGPTQITWMVLEEGIDEPLLVLREAYWINYFSTMDAGVYNLRLPARRGYRAVRIHGLPRLTCLHCAHEWTPRQADVRTCPCCHTARWDEPRPPRQPRQLSLWGKPQRVKAV